MAKFSTGYNAKYADGRLHKLDDLGPGDPGLGAAIATYADGLNDNRNSRHWIRAVQWIENILFTLGRHYADDILTSRLARDTNSDQSVVSEATRNIPKPVNDFLGRYIETNISLLTENRPQPRVQAKSNKAEDEDAAELSQLVLEYLWDELDLPAKHREVARTMISCGVCWMETTWDELQPRRMAIPKTNMSQNAQLPGPGGVITVPVSRPIPSYTAEGELEYTEKLVYGDITAKIVTPFEMHLPVGHRWDGDDMPWLIREWYIDKDVFLDRFGETPKKRGLTKKRGWYLDNLEKVGASNIKNLPLWWWERLTDVVEGPGPSIYGGAPEQWDQYTIVRWFDRRPNPRWPRGRSVLVAGDQVIYDSPKEVGARGYNPRWPNRWHPYTRFVWEPMLGSMYGRSLISKLLPKLKRVNAIDTTLIMWRRTVPIATWIMPTGSNPVDDNWCLPASARVITSTGTKKITDIIEGDEVLAAGKFARVTALHNNGERNEFSVIRAAYNSEFKITPNHIIPILRDGFKIEVKAEDIQKGDYLIRWVDRARTRDDKLDLVDIIDAEEIRTKDGIKTRRWERRNKGAPCILNRSATISLSESFLWLLGLYAAEGSTSKHQVSFSINYNETNLEEEIIRVSEKIFGITPTTYEAEDKGIRIVRINNSILARLFKTLIPGTARSKCISPEVFEANCSLLPLVAGWLDGDGSSGTYKGSKYFGGTTASQSLAHQLMLILLDEELLVRLYKTRRQTALSPEQRTYWKVDLSFGCKTLLSNKSIRFKGIEGPKPKVATDAYNEENYWFFKVKSVCIKTQKTSEPVYDISTDIGYYNYRGIIIHNSGRPGGIWEYDPQRTRGNEPKPVFPPEYPRTALEERSTQIAEMESIAGTEEVLRGQRPTGVNSAAMLHALRASALASRSPLLQSWDEGLEDEAGIHLELTIAHVRKDPQFAEQLRILSNQKKSAMTIATFSGTDMSDNVTVKIDTASQALGAREARKQQALEIMQYAPSLMPLPAGLRSALVEELGYKEALLPQGTQIKRIKRMMSWIRSKQYDKVIPLQYDDPYVCMELLVEEIQSDSFYNLDEEQAMTLLGLADMYEMQIQARQAQMMAMQQAQAAAGVQPKQ